MNKTCTKCGVEKQAEKFHSSTRGIFGRSAHCIDCHRAGGRAWYAKNREKVKQSVKKWVSENPDKRRANASRWASAFAAKNPGIIAGRNRKWNSENPEKRAAASKAWHEANADKTLAWRRANASTLRAQDARRRAAKLRATPVWADHEAISLIYAEAVRRGMEVDHIVPLMGKNVRGLHVEYNMQLLTRKQNATKGNRLARAA